MPHECHAPGCGKQVPPKMFACREHWYKLRRPMREAIWREYRPGQESDKNPSLRYLAVQTLARAWLAFKPNDEEAAHLTANLIIAAKSFRTQAIEAGVGDPFQEIDMPWVQELRT